MQYTRRDATLVLCRTDVSVRGEAARGLGHIYHHCKTVGILRPPNALVNWYEGDTSYFDFQEPCGRVIIRLDF